jgi:hypothetical protein
MGTNLKDLVHSKVKSAGVQPRVLAEAYFSLFEFLLEMLHILLLFLQKVSILFGLITLGS